MVKADADGAGFLGAKAKRHVAAFLTLPRFTVRKRADWRHKSFYGWAKVYGRCRRC